jgi:hypothetical protein
MFELQSCRSRRDLQLLYKAFLHPIFYEIVVIFFFENVKELIIVSNDGSRMK